MPRDVFHEQLERLEEALQEQGQLVLRALRSSVNALTAATSAWRTR